ncbi:MAG: XdhC family protein [Thermoplasmata archaeon]|nr:XdhC family protein [Thermoplasmata archaeon]
MQVAHFSKRLSELTAQREPFAVATVTRTEGSTLAKPGFKLLIAHDGTVAGGTLGGGCPEGPIVAVAQETMKTGEPRVVRIHLVDTEKSVAGLVRETNPDEIWVQTNCGGILEVYVEPMLPSQRLVLVGQGGKDEIEAALVHLGKLLAFEVVVIDPLPVLPEAPSKVIESSLVDPAELGPHDYVVVLTKGERDVAVLEAVSKGGVKFAGLLASRQRLRQNLTELERRGVDPAFLRSLHAPIGLDIGARTPQELALAILSDVISTRYGKHADHPAPTG